MSHNPKKWQFEKPKDFKEQVLDLPKEVRPRLTEVMTLLSESNNPLIEGKKKATRNGEFYTIRLNDTYRLAYDVPDPKNKTIRIIRVGSHNFTYGKK